MQILPIKAEGPALRDPRGKNTIFGLQALRFVAATMVVITHALNREVTLFHPAALPRAAWMEAGVDIFFCISGFIMVYIVKDDTEPGAFWLQRFTRIAPLYWLATAIAFGGGLLLPEWFFGQQSPVFALQSALFLPVGPTDQVHPLVSPGWTLIYEFAFYTVLALCMLARRPPFVLATVIIGANLAFGFLVISHVQWLAYYGDELLMIEFLFGMGAAWLAPRVKVDPWIGLLIAVGGITLLFFAWDWPDAWPRGLRIGVPALIVLLGTLWSEPLWQRYRPMQVFARLGDASYSIYIVHFFFVTALMTLFTKVPWLQSIFGSVGYVALAVEIGLGAGILAHIFVERPLLRLVRSWSAGRGTAQRLVVTSPKV